jgi:hypothetical protein
MMSHPETPRFFEQIKSCSARAEKADGDQLRGRRKIHFYKKGKRTSIKEKTAGRPAHAERT